MTTSVVHAVCPICSARQDLGLACSSCCDRLEGELRRVPAVVEDLDISVSKMSRIGATGKSGKGSVHERWPVNVGAVKAGDVLTSTLVLWAEEVTGTRLSPSSAPAAALSLLDNVNLIRRHGEVVKMVDDIHSAIGQARRAVDRPADRVFVGPCMADTPDDEGRKVTCLADLYARVGSAVVRCLVCRAEHPVAERRAWLLLQAASMLFSVRESAQMLGDIGGIRVTEDRIRGYLRRGRVGFHTGNLIRLGDLLDIVLDDGSSKTKKKEKAA